MTKYKYIIMFIILGLVACSAPKKEILQETQTVVETTFLTEAVEPSQTGEGFSFFLPSNYEIEAEKENNIVLSNGKQTFILFVNLLEDPKSQVIYDTMMENQDNVMLTKTFTDDENRFGYLYIRSVEKDLFEVSVGVGGVKVTTQVAIKDMAEQVENMMKVANSVKYVEEQRHSIKE